MNCTYATNGTLTFLNKTRFRFRKQTLNKLRWGKNVNILPQATIFNDSDHFCAQEPFRNFKILKLSNEKT